MHHNRFLATTLGHSIASTFGDLLLHDEQRLRAVIHKVEGVMAEISSLPLRREILLETLLNLTLVEWDHVRDAHLLGYASVLGNGPQPFPMPAFISACEKRDNTLINKYIETYRLTLVSH